MSSPISAAGILRSTRTSSHRPLAWAVSETICNWLSRWPRGIEFAQIEFQLAGLDLKIQQVVDQPQKRNPGRIDLGDLIHLARLKRGALQQMRKPEDRVDRCADFMADIGQKRCFLRRLAVSASRVRSLKRAAFAHQLIVEPAHAAKGPLHLVDDPKQNRRLKGDDHSMQEHPRDIAFAGKDR